jgi:ribosomal protein S18 acetylase RimI-like enzyme
MPVLHSGMAPVLPAGTRLVPWRAGDGRAHLVISHTTPLHPGAVDACVERARHEGYTGIVTSALGPGEQVPFAARGFTAQDHLHLLSCTLRREPPAAMLGVRRVRRRERSDVLAVDDVAFTPNWRLGPSGLRDALGATPFRQFRATGVRGGLTGYAITGFDGRHGYLQRLATRPDHQRRGVGRALVADALRYSWRRGATRVFVNTQLENTGALALYTACGFEQLPGGLVVLERSW